MLPSREKSIDGGDGLLRLAEACVRPRLPEKQLSQPPAAPDVPGPPLEFFHRGNSRGVVTRMESDEGQPVVDADAERRDTMPGSNSSARRPATTACPNLPAEMCAVASAR